MLWFGLKHVLQKKPIISLFSALPPPVLPPFCPLFASLVNILQSDVMLLIMRTVLQWTVEHSGHIWSESMLQRVLHLIGMALQEEKQHLENVMEEHVITFTFTQKISSMYTTSTKLTQHISDFLSVV